MAGPSESLLLRYKGVDEAVHPAGERRTKHILSHALVQPTLHPRVANPPPAATRRLVMDFQRHMVPEVGLRWFVGNLTLRMPDEPLLAAAHFRRPFQKASVLELHRGEVVDVIFNNVGSETGPHPFHLHGHEMWYLGVGKEKGAFDATRHEHLLNTQNPPLMDVFEVPHNGFAAVRFRVDNAGAWLFHCHISPHHLAGMGFVVLIDPTSAPP